MIDDYEQQRRKRTIRIRSTVDYVMGFILLSVGVYFLIYERMGWTLMNRAPSSVDQLIGGLFVLYGAWRIYRGYKKNYFKSE